MVITKGGFFVAGRIKTKKSKIKMSISEQIFMVIVYTVLILFTLAALYPFVNVIAVSFSSSRAVGAGEVVLWPIEFNVDAYRQLLLDGQIFASMKIQWF